jgi:SAM-dependent methyltransferase
VENIDDPTVRAFDEKWGARWRGKSDGAAGERAFAAFFSLFPLDKLREAEGFDLGCGVGRHAERIAPNVGRLHCIDPSPKGLAAARHALSGRTNVEFHLASVDDMPLADGSQDFGYSMGVLHHVPNTEDGLTRCVAKLKPGAPFLLYLYYRFDNRPPWFRAIWKLTDWARRVICWLPFRARKAVCDGIAVGVYLPLSRLALHLEKRGVDVENLPLSSYRRTPLVNLKVSSLDRFGTPLERRFTRKEIEGMMKRSGLGRHYFSGAHTLLGRAGIQTPVLKSLAAMLQSYREPNVPMGRRRTLNRLSTCQMASRGVTHSRVVMERLMLRDMMTLRHMTLSPHQPLAGVMPHHLTVAHAPAPADRFLGRSRMGHLWMHMRRAMACTRHSIMRSCRAMVRARSSVIADVHPTVPRCSRRHWRERRWRLGRGLHIGRGRRRHAGRGLLRRR